MNKITGKLIAIEGLDGTGKYTQSRLLLDHLTEKHGQTKLYSFPRYSTSTGKRVADYLNGRLGELNLLQMAELYCADRLAARAEILDDLYRGYNVICDRYCLSNWAYFTAMARIEVDAGRAKSGYAANIDKHLHETEFVVNKLPLPNLTVFLDIPLEESKKFVAMKGKRDYTDKEQDEHESNHDLLEYVYQQYHWAAGTDTEWSTSHYNRKAHNIVALDCYDLRNKQVHSIERIHANMKSLIDAQFLNVFTIN